MTKEQIFKNFAEKNPVLMGLNDLMNFSKFDSPLVEESEPYYPKRNDFFFFVPESLNLDELLQKAVANKLKPYKIVRFLSVIGQQSIHKRRNFDSSGYQFFSKSHARIKAKNLEKMVAKDFLIYYEFLKNENVINRAPYKPGVKNHGYGYLPHLRYQRLSIKLFSANKLT